MLRFVSWAYFGGLLLLPLLWKVKGELHWLLALTRYSPPAVYAVPLGLLVLVALVTRNKAVAFPVVASLVVIGFLYADVILNFPRRETGQLRVLTWNILKGVGGSQAIGTYVAQQQPDLVLIQEGDASTRFGDPIPRVSSALPGFYSARGGLREELAIYSRFPLEDVREVDLGEGKPGLAATVVMPSRRVRVINVHYSHGDQVMLLRSVLRRMAEARAVQTAALVREISSGEGALVVGGDFNSPPGSATHQAMEGLLQDAYRTTGLGLGLTYHSHLPLWRIDYLFASREFTVRRCVPLPSKLSDHRPLMAELDFAP